MTPPLIIEVPGPGGIPTDLDLSAALAVTRSAPEKVWLAALISPVGLHFYGHTRYGTGWSAADIDNFLKRLHAARFTIAHQPGPRGGRGIYRLTGHVAA